MTTDTLNVIGTVVSCMAAGVTAWMAIETRRMANAAQETVNLDRAPLLGVKGLAAELHVEQDAPGKVVGARIGVELFNAGRVPVRYELSEMRVTFEGRTVDPCKFVSRSDTILPGSSTLFRYQAIKLDPPLERFPMNGRLSCRFWYGTPANPRAYTLDRVLEFSIFGDNRVTWVNVDDQGS